MTDETERCHVCDDDGMLPSRRKCNHTDDVARAVRGAALARALIRPTITPESRVTEEA
jgi:hypothetical protein